MTFREKLEARQRKVNSLLCVGLDSEYEKIPNYVKELVREHYAQSDFSQQIHFFHVSIFQETSRYVCAYKFNFGFSLVHHTKGLQVLESALGLLKGSAPKKFEWMNVYSDIPIILDGKWSDIGNSAKEYAKYVFDVLGVDAVTVNPYLGYEGALEPFLERKDKGIIVLCRTSNPGAKEFQDLPVTIDGVTRPLYQWVAHNVATKWNKNNNCLLVVGATYPEELKQVRQIVGDMPILVPGVGSQGGDLEAVLRNGLRLDGLGLIINASRSVIFASSDKDFAEAAGKEAQKLRDLINQYREGRKNGK